MFFSTLSASNSDDPGVDGPAREAARTSGAAPERLDFDEIYNAYSQRVLHLVYRFVRREDVARDIVQEVFIKVYHNLDSFRRESNPYTWVYRITVNHVLNHLKREKRSYWSALMDKTIGDAFADERQAREAEGVSDLPQPDAALEQTERERIVNQAVESLPVKYKVPFMLYRYEEMSYQEIATTLGLSLSAVETRIHRAKKQLIEKLEPWLGHI